MPEVAGKTSTEEGCCLAYLRVDNTVHGQTFPCPQKPSFSQLFAECVNVRCTKKQRNLSIKALSLEPTFRQTWERIRVSRTGNLGAAPFANRKKTDWVIGTTGIP